MHAFRNLTFGAVALLLSGVASSTHATDVTTCGQTIAAGDTGVLQADLTCSSGAFAVQLMHNARLQLNGHTLARVDDAGGSGTATVLGSGDGMAARFKILGPGTIAGTSADPHFPLR